MPNVSNYSHILPGIQREGKPLQRAVTHFDDFIVGGFKADAGLSMETDPSSKFGTVANAGEWFLSLTGTGTNIISDAGPNGILTMTTGATENDSNEMQLNGESFKLATGKRLIFEVRAKFEDVSLSNWFIGLAETEVNVIDGVTDYIGFYSNIDANAQYGVAKNGSAAVQGSKTAASTTQDGETNGDTGVALVDDTFNVFRFECNGLKAKFFVDGAYIATLNAIEDSSGNSQDFPDDISVTPTLAIQNDSAAAEKMEVDYILVAADRH
jgi:hypothetical protein